MTDWNKIVRGTSDEALVQIYGSSTFPQEAIYAAGMELTRRSEPDPTPYLTRWRNELAAGTRNEFVFDAVWRKACEEFTDGYRIFRARPRWSDQDEYYPDDYSSR